MHGLPDEAVPWVSAAAADEDALEIAPRPADAILGAAPARKSKAVLPRSAPALGARLFMYGPHAALTACLIGAALLVGSHLVARAPVAVQQESVQSAETGQTAQKMAEEPPAQRADLEAMRAAQSLSTKDVTSLGNTQPRLDAAKTEISAGIGEASGRVGRLRPKSAENAPKASERLDRIGLEIAALLAATPVGDRSMSAAPVARKRAPGGRGDAFDPSENPTAPGAPRPLGTIRQAAPTNNSAAQYAYRQRTN
jgi:hypothetical protein